MNLKKMNKGLGFLQLAAAFIFSFLIFDSRVAHARVEPGENIILNGSLDCDGTRIPGGWVCFNDDPGEICAEPWGCLGDMPSFGFANPSGKPKTFAIRQTGLTLVPGAKYRISAKVRTKNFRCSNYGIAVTSDEWTRETGLKGFKPDQDWTAQSVEVTMIDSRLKNNYMFVFHASKYTGTIEIADVRFEAVSPAALEGSLAISNSGDTRLPRLVPVRPILARIPRDCREIAFRFYGRLPDKGTVSDFDVVLSASNAFTRTALSANETLVPLPDGAESGRMEVRLVRRTDNKEILKDEYRFSVVDAPPATHTVGRRLNNLVVELVAEDVPSDDASFEFTLADESWVFVALQKAGSAVEIDGEEIIGSHSPGGETFRRVAEGRHVLRARGGKDGRILVRKIAEIFNYTSFVNSFVAENGPYGWPFCEKYVFPATTTQNGGEIKADEASVYRRRGGKWFASIGVSSATSAADVLNRLRGSSILRSEQFDGLTCDEEFFDKPSKLADFTAGLKAFNAAYQGDKIVYTWATAKPSSPGVDQAFLSACANASRGRGRILCETYCMTRATEAEAKAYFADHIAGTMRKVAALYPDAFKSTGLILANYTQIPIISVWHHPEVDYKYFLDLQFNLIANDPIFRDMPITGVWGSYYADREIHRWTMAILRHYCVEGRTDMLSEKFGFRYLPGHVANNDFVDGLAGWTATGEVRTDKAGDLAYPVEGRRSHAVGQGDTYAYLVKKPGETASVAQTVKGLVPGRQYCLRICLFDAKDLRARRAAPRRIELDVALGASARIDTDLSWRHVAKPRKRSPRAGAFVNYEQIVFRATAPEVELRVSNDAAPDGSELGVNYVSLCPFFPE
jgi:hypothetical protein